MKFSTENNNVQKFLKAKIGFKRIAEKLRKTPGFDINSRDGYGLSMLHYALLYNASDKVVEILINYLKADLSLPIGDGHNSELWFDWCPSIVQGMPPLHIAAALTKPSSFLTRFIDNSADVNGKDLQGNTPLDICLKRITTSLSSEPIVKSYVPIMDLLQRHGGKVTTQAEPFMQNTHLQHTIDAICESEYIPPLSERIISVIQNEPIKWSEHQWHKAFIFGAVRANSETEKWKNQESALKELAGNIGNLPRELQYHLATFLAPEEIRLQDNEKTTQEEAPSPRSFTQRCRSATQGFGSFLKRHNSQDEEKKVSRGK